MAHWLTRLLLDVASIFIVFIPWIVLKSGVSPYQRGFFCDDLSIKYPYKNSTITNTVLTSVSVLLPALIFCVAEFFAWFIIDRKKSSHTFTVGQFILPKALIRIYNLFAVYYFGLLLQQTVTNIGKFSIGRLRPHFLDICRPDYSLFNCTSHNGLALYVDKPELCTGENEYRLEQARLSFPSGHSSMSTYAAMFSIIYLQYRLTHVDFRLLRSLIQSILAYMAIFTCLSRVSDYKHHWSDVFAGAFIGVCIAALMACQVSKFFQSDRNQTAYDSSDTNTVGSAMSNVRPDIDLNEATFQATHLEKRHSRSEYM